MVLRLSGSHCELYKRCNQHRTGSVIVMHVSLQLVLTKLRRSKLETSETSEAQLNFILRMNRKTKSGTNAKKNPDSQNQTKGLTKQMQSKKQN